MATEDKELERSHSRTVVVLLTCIHIRDARPWLVSKSGRVDKARPPRHFSLYEYSRAMSEIVLRDLSYRRLESLEDDLLEEIASRGVTEFDLSNNLLPGLPPTVSRLQTLRKLNLSSNQIRELPPEICQLTGLEALEVKHNLMKGLPNKFGRLKSLKALNLSSNQFEQFPGQLCELEALRELRIGANFISHLPPTIGKLKG